MHPAIHAFTVHEYQQFLELQPDESMVRYELIKGVIYEMPPIGAEHNYTVTLLTQLLGEMINKNFFVQVQGPIQLEDSQPQPDLVVLQRDDRLRFALPTPDVCKLLIEVADTSVKYDREIKAFLYAEAGIPEYWLVNLPDGVIQQYQEPTHAGYNVQRTWRRGEFITTPQFSAVKISVTEVVGG